jgi:hypothetical protein
MEEVLHSSVFYFTTLKFKFYVCRSTFGLCKVSHDNPMMIGCVGDEMTLKITLLLCDPMMVSNALVSCITCPKKIVQPSMISTSIKVAFFTNANLCCRTKSLWMKHANELDSKLELALRMQPCPKKCNIPIVEIECIQCNWLWFLHEGIAIY